MYSEDPEWKQLITHPLAAHERRSLVITIFSDRNQIEMVGHLSGDDAQRFVDVVDEVSFRIISRSKDKPIKTSTYFQLGDG